MASPSRRSKRPSSRTIVPRNRAQRRRPRYTAPSVDVAPEVLRSIVGIVLMVLGAIVLIGMLLPGQGALTDWIRNVIAPWFGTGRWILPFLLLGAGIYVERGLTAELALQVADQLTAKDALGAHMRDELGHSHATRARPTQAALASAAAFGVGAAPPVLLAFLIPLASVPTVVTATTLMLLVALGAMAAHLGGAPKTRAAVRVAFWGAVALGATSLVGRLFGTVV